MTRAQAPLPGVRVVSREGGLDDTARVVTRALLDLLRGPLSGSFVMDSRLLDAARIPFTREVGHLSGVSRDFEHQDLVRLLRRRAQVFQAELAAMAAELQRPMHCEHCGGDALSHALQAMNEPGAVVITASGAEQARPTVANRRAVSVILREGDAGKDILRAAQALGRCLALPVHIRRLAAPTPQADHPDVAQAGRRTNARTDVVVISASALPGDGAERTAALAAIGGLVVLMTPVDGDAPSPLP